MKELTIKYKDIPRLVYNIDVFFNLGKNKVTYPNIVAPNETIAIAKLAPKTKKLYAITNICVEFVRAE